MHAVCATLCVQETGCEHKHEMTRRADTTTDVLKIAVEMCVMCQLWVKC